MRLKNERQTNFIYHACTYWYRLNFRKFNFFDVLLLVGNHLTGVSVPAADIWVSRQSVRLHQFVGTFRPILIDFPPSTYNQRIAGLPTIRLTIGAS